MSRSTCHIGVAFYAHPSFPTQWALVLSESPVFDGPVWCSTAVETVNGWGASWTPCDWSPAGFNPMALFSGVVYVTQAAMPTNHMQALISRSNVASELDRFRVQGTWRHSSSAPTNTSSSSFSVSARDAISGSPKLNPSDLSNFIRGRVPDLQRAQRTQGGNAYPVVSLENGNVSFGRLGH
ncbi:hypothetical protein EDB89DRAFT_1908188 [Lactarius sanguifluus]|nr:hypothetical protein EDB89DRAFT_1908188 [Lactarius sanguifluus]